MTPWWVTFIISIVTFIIGIIIRGIWQRLKWWPFSPESLHECSSYNIIKPNSIQSLSLRPRGRKSLRLERIIPSPEYVPNTLQIICSQEDKTFFDAPLVAGISERGILSGSNLLISVRKPLQVEIRNISNLNQGIRLSFLYSGADDLLVIESEVVASTYPTTN